MSAFVTEFDTPVVAAESASAVDILNRNMLTTTGVLIAGSTAVAGGAVLTAALPVQMLGSAAISAGLIYAGDRQHKGLPINPFKKLQEALEATAEVTPEVA